MQTAQFDLHARIEERHWWFVGRRRIMRRLIEAIVPAGAEKTVVDVGCGTGANLASLADGYRAVGIDTSAEAIQAARVRFPKIQFVRGRAPDDLGRLAAEADLFLLMDVLEHVADDFRLLSEIVAAAKPGAHLLMTVPADLSLWSRHDESFGHYRRYDDERLVQAWRGLPVSPRLVSYFNARLRPIVKAVRMANRFRGRAAGEAGTDFKLPLDPVNRLLTETFAGEANRLIGALDKRTARGYSRGVSLLAVLRREPGRCEIRDKPTDVAADYWDPVAGELIGAPG